MTTDSPTTAQRILAVMRDIGDVPKDDENAAQHYKYRGWERTAPRVRDAMVAHGLLCIPTEVELLVHGDREAKSGGTQHFVMVRETFVFRSADDKSDEIPAQIIGEGQDSLDKAMTKALTAAHKYLANQTFVIGDGSGDGDSGAGYGDDGDDDPDRFAATEEEVSRVEAALALVHEDDRPIVNSFWKLIAFGSLSSRRLDNRSLRAFFALTDSLASARSVK